jgi:hypothetical protein
MVIIAHIQNNMGVVEGVTIFINILSYCFIDSRVRRGKKWLVQWKEKKIA